MGTSASDWPQQEMFTSAPTSVIKECWSTSDLFRTSEEISRIGRRLWVTSLVGAMGSLDDFDAAALQHALTVIDDWGIDAASLLDEHDDGGLVKPPVSPSTTKRTRPTAPYSQRCHGTSLKRELHGLRAHAELLQRDLVNEQHTILVQPLETTASEAGALQHECRDMATRQYRARFIAEMRNKDLRKLVDELRRDAVKIERLGRRMLSLKRTLPRHASFPIAAFDGPREAPQIQLSRLPGLAQEAATIFARGAFAEHNDDRLKIFREVALHDTRSSSGLLEAVFETAWVLPFDVDDVARALWLQTTRVTTGTNDIQWLVRGGSLCLLSNEELVTNCVLTFGRMSTWTMPLSCRNLCPWPLMM
jgi:hypothetical protein